MRYGFAFKIVGWSCCADSEGASVFLFLSLVLINLFGELTGADDK